MQERLQQVLQAFTLAQERPEQKHLYVTQKLLKDVMQQEDNMRVSLACYLHTNRQAIFHSVLTKLAEWSVRDLETSFMHSTSFGGDVDLVRQRLCASNIECAKRDTEATPPSKKWQ